MMKLMTYKEEYDLYIEVNNYLYFLNEVCEENSGVRRFAYRLCYLFEKLNELSFDDPEDSPLFLRNKRKSLRYAKEVKKNIKSIKLCDISVFEKASKRLVRNNFDVYNDSLRDFSRYIGLDADKMARVLSGDLSNLFSNKRLSSSKINLDDKMTEMEQQMEEIEKKLSISSDRTNDEDDFNNRLLTKKELEQLKKEIDAGDSLFIDIKAISYEQSCVINNYVSLRNSLASFSLDIKNINLNNDNLYVKNLYEKLYSIVEKIVSTKYEQVIQLSKVVFDGVSYHVMDRNVIEVFDIYNSFLPYISNIVQVFDNKIFSKISTSEKDKLKSELWRRHRLLGVTAYDINEVVSYNILAFIMENPFALLQTNNQVDTGFKKYDLSILLEFVVPELVGTTVYVVKSLEDSIQNSTYSEENKKNMLSIIKKTFSQKYVVDLGVNEMPDCSHDYFVKYVIDVIYSNNKNLDDIKLLRDDVIDRIYGQLMQEYKSLSLFSRLFGSVSKPSYDVIRDKIVKFENKLLKSALKLIM